MTVLLFAILILALWRAKFTVSGFHQDCLSRETTTAVNGIFVLLVFLRHFSQYIQYGRFDGIFRIVDSRLDQLIVVPFLFYSGYGILLSITRKGKDYVNQVLTHRFPKVWYHFALAVLLFAVARIFLGKQDPPKTILLSMTGWSSIGNSNWYVFAMLALYRFTFAAFRVAGKRHWVGVCLVSALCVCYILLLKPVKSHWWYDTLFAYPAGMAAALLAGKLRGITNRRYLAAWVITFFAAVLCWKFRKNIWLYQGLCLCFALSILLITMKIRPGNPVLAFLGKYTFEIYILQRIPMMVLEKWIPTSGIWKAPYFLLCFAITIGLSLIFRKCTDFLDRKLFPRSKT